MTIACFPFERMMFKQGMAVRDHSCRTEDVRLSVSGRNLTVSTTTVRV
jgi:hypothetical protein